MRTNIGDLTVSTVYVGMNLQDLGETDFPTTWETIIYPTPQEGRKTFVAFEHLHKGPYSDRARYYGTEEDAQAGHGEVVGALEQGKVPPGLVGRVS